MYFFANDLSAILLSRTKLTTGEQSRLSKFIQPSRRYLLPGTVPGSVQDLVLVTQTDPGMNQGRARSLKMEARSFMLNDHRKKDKKL